MESDTKDNLDLSIRLLNQDATQRRTFLRLNTKSSTPRRISLQASTVNKNADNRRQTSNIFNTKSLHRSYITDILMKAQDASGIDNSLTIEPHDVQDGTSYQDKKDYTLREMMEDSCATGIILKTNEPWRTANAKLYHDFLQSVQAHVSEAQIFDTIGDFIQNCTDTLEIMRGMQSKVETADTSDEEIFLENERNTWRLIYCLYRNRLSSNSFQMTEDEDSSMADSTHISEKDVIENLYKNEFYIREYQLIVDWLEKNALDQIGKYPVIEHFTDKTVAWENTLHQMYNQVRIAFGSSVPLVTSLDPDAPVREGKPLHYLDQEDDARLEQRMFIEVRCGRLQKAQALSIHCGQPWRAACLMGWLPHDDPNYRNPLTDTKLPTEGNPNRSLWKLCAWELSQDKRLGQYYRAIYASLCGNVQQMLQVANSWQDGLWAYLKALLDIKVESELRATMAKNYTAMPEEYWKNELKLEDIFQELHALQHPVIRAESNKPDHLIQKYLILDQVPKLMEDIECMLDSGTCNGQFLRFLAHLVLFLRQVGKSTKEKIENQVLLAYVRVLIQMGDPILVAFYTATLPQEDQITNYAYFLEGVKDHEKRKKCLSAAEDANLNIEAITKLVVETIRLKCLDNEPTDMKGSVTDADMEKINALDWLLFYQSQREEALWQTNALIRYFITNEKIDAARKAFNKIPPDCIESINAEYPSMEGTLANLTVTGSLSKKASSAIREYLCYKTYLDAHEGFMEWFSHFHHGKPSPLEELPVYATFTEKVAYDHKKAQYNTELERWKCTMQHHTKAVKQLLFNVLLFPYGGWLGDSNGNSDEPLTNEEVMREHQLEKLRSLCIPKITLLLYSVMSDMNEHAGCVQLADTLASEQHQLYKVFSKSSLREVFRKICESSLALMDQKKDPWGY